MVIAVAIVFNGFRVKLYIENRQHRHHAAAAAPAPLQGTKYRLPSQLVALIHGEAQALQDEGYLPLAGVVGDPAAEPCAQEGEREATSQSPTGRVLSGSSGVMDDNRTGFQYAA
jgi:hypothetical protein